MIKIIKHQPFRKTRFQNEKTYFRRGLTLLEILIAAGLMASLLVALWQAIGVYATLRDKGEAHTQRVRSVSIMLKQFEDDLRSMPDISSSDSETENAATDSLVQEPESVQPRDQASPTSEEDQQEPSEDNLGRTEQAPDSSIQPGSLYGDETSLTLTQASTTFDATVSQTEDSPEEEHGESSPNDLESLSSSSMPKEDEIRIPVRTIRYWLAGVAPLGAAALQSAVELPLTGQNSDDLLANQPSPQGLVREEVEGVESFATLPHDEMGHATNEQDDRPKQESENDIDPSLDQAEPTDASRKSFQLPEVEWAKFRYFDGVAWHTSWDSRAQGSLPVAIEMSLWLAKRHKGDSSRKEAADSSTQADKAPSDRESMDPKTDRRVASSHMESSSNSTFGEGNIPPLEGENTYASNGQEPRLPELRRLIVLREPPTRKDSIEELTSPPSPIIPQDSP